MPQRILLLSDIFPPKTGGSGRWFWEIYSRFPPESVVVAAGEGPGAIEHDKTHPLQVHRLPIEMRTRGLRPLSNLKKYWRTAKAIRRLLRAERGTIVHAARNLPEGFIAYLVKKVRGTPYLCYVHGEDVGVSATSRELAWMTRRVFSRASLVIANSNNTRQMLLTEWGLPEAKVRLLYPGVDTTRFVPAPRCDQTRAQLGWDQRRVVLTVGRLQKRKGHDMLIRALPEIRRAVPNVLYAILGEGEEMPALVKLADQLGVSEQVQFLGEVDDTILAQCYQQCDLFALPNRAVGRDIEGFGMVLLEAQASGRPVIAGASGGTAETMSSPETGMVVNCDEPGPLASLVVELLQDPARLDRMGAAGREWVTARFDWKALAREAAELFDVKP